MEKQLDRRVSEYLSKIGRSGGRKSRRKLSKEQAQTMVRVREARRLFRKYHAQCFWSSDPNYQVSIHDLPWVATQLMKYGDRSLWIKGKKLCP